MVAAAQTEAEAFAKDSAKSWEDIEAELLSGQKLQGPSTCMDAPWTSIMEDTSLLEDM